MIDAIDLVNFARSAKQNGVKYLFGANYEILTPERLEYLYKNNPKYISESRYNYAKNNYIGKTVTDCSGLIYGFLKDAKRRTSEQLLKKANKRVEINENNINKIPVGAVLWTENHVGISTGNGREIEARGFDYGIQERNIKDTKFTHYLLFDDFKYKSKKIIPWLIAGGILLILITKKND